MSSLFLGSTGYQRGSENLGGNVGHFLEEVSDRAERVRWGTYQGLGRV